jgi:hypothetical protein
LFSFCLGSKRGLDPRAVSPFHRGEFTITPSKSNSQDSGTQRNIVDMEIDSVEILYWVAQRIDESQQITEDLAT